MVSSTSSPDSITPTSTQPFSPFGGAHAAGSSSSPWTTPPTTASASSSSRWTDPAPPVKRWDNYQQHYETDEDDGREDDGETSMGGSTQTLTNSLAERLYKVVAGPSLPWFSFLFACRQLKRVLCIGCGLSLDRVRTFFLSAARTLARS